MTRLAAATLFALAACGAGGKPRPNDRICPPVARCVADPAPPAPAAPPVDAGTVPESDAPVATP